MTLQPFLEKLKQTVLISDVIKTHVRLTRKGDEYTGLCPFHSEKTPSFTLNDQKGFYYCFGCGASGSMFDFLMSKENLTFMEAVHKIASVAGLQVPTFDNPTPLQPILSVLEEAKNWFQSELKKSSPAQNYLHKRGLHKETISTFQIGYAPNQGLKAYLLSKGFKIHDLLQAGLLSSKDDKASNTYDKFRNRIMFPIWNQSGQVIAFGGRLIEAGEPKYLNSPDTPTFKKGEELFGHHLAIPFARQGKPYILVEGYLDVISLYQAGYKCAVAPLGTAVTAQQIQKLWTHCKEPIICFDGDAAGAKAAERVLHKVLPILKVGGYSVQFLLLPSNEDPDSFIQRYGLQAFETLIKDKSINLVDFLWLKSMEGLPAQTPEQKAAIKQRAFDLIETIPHADLKYLYKKEINLRFNNHFFAPYHIKKNQPLPSLTRSVPKKEDIAPKILLAILFDNPILIEEYIENLTMLEFHDSDLEYLKDYLINHYHECLDRHWEHTPAIVTRLQKIKENPGVKLVINKNNQPASYWKQIWEEIYWSFCRTTK